MPNSYYTFTDTFIPGSRARSGDLDREYQAIEAGFDELPADSQAINTGRAAFAGTSAGAGNAYEVTMPATRISNTNGDEVIFIADKSNTGAATLNVDGIGAQALVRADGSAVVANDIQTGLMYVARYDSGNTRFQLIGPSASYLTNAAAAAAAAAASETAAGLSEVAAGLSETNAGISESNAAVSAAAAEDWAIHPEDSLVPASSGGNEIDEYSAYHWAQKAAGSSGLPIGASGQLLYYNGGWSATSAVSLSEGAAALTNLSLTAPTGFDAELSLYEGASERFRLLYDEDVDLVKLRALGALTTFQIEEGPGTFIAATFDPSGAQTFYYGGAQVLATTSDGVAVRSPLDANPIFGLFTNAGTRNAYIQAQGTSGLIIENEVHGTPITLQGEDALGALQTLLVADPDTSLDFYYDGLQVAETTATGMLIEPTAGQAPLLDVHGQGASIRATVAARSDGGGVGLSFIASTGISELEQLSAVGGIDKTWIQMIRDQGVRINYNATNKFRTISTGVSMGQNGTEIEVIDDGTNHIINGRIHGAPMVISAEDAVGALQPLFNGDPDAASALYYNGAVAVLTDVSGLVVRDTSGSTAAATFQTDAGVQNGVIFTESGSNGLVARSNVHGGLVVLDGEDAGGVVRSLFVGDPDGIADLYYDGSIALRTDVDGVIIRDPTASVPELKLQTSAGTQHALFSASSTFAIWRGSVNSQEMQIVGQDSGGTGRTGFHFDPDGGAGSGAAYVELHADGGYTFVTQAYNGAYNSSGAQVRDHGGTLRDVGYNVMPVTEADASQTFDENDVGKMMHRDATGSITYTLPSGTSGAIPPVGSMIMITNENASGTVSITPAGTLRWFAGTGTPATGTRTLAHGGVCTVYHYSSTEWWIWGSGIA